LIIALPNLWWVASHQERALALTYKFGIEQSMPWAKAVRIGLVKWISALAVHIGPLLVPFGILFWRPLFVERKVRVQDEDVRLLCRAILLVIAIAILSVLLLKVTHFKDRWLQPLFVTLPILLV